MTTQETHAPMAHRPLAEGGQPCPRCGSYLDPHSCPPEWVVWADGYPGIVTRVCALGASQAAEDGAAKLNLSPGERKMYARDGAGRVYSGRCRSVVAVQHTAILLREEPGQ